MKATSTNSAPRRLATTKSMGSIVVVILVVLYGVLQPRLNDRFGWELPGLGGPSGDDVAQADGQDSASQITLPTQEIDERDVDDSRLGEPVAEVDSPATIEKPLPKPQENADADLRYGLLREIRNDRFLSPAGLEYVPGSAEGHRLEHLRRHTKDQPSRPGKHGVFDGGMEGALVTIDRAYDRAKKKQRTTKQTSRDRTIYTVDMGRRVGYVGGREGKSSGNPMARRVKLVLEGTRFITAFPL